MKSDMPLWLRFRSAIVAAALFAVVISVVVAGTVIGIATARSQHSTLDAASVAMRYAVHDMTATQTASMLTSMQGALTAWGVTAAAFDRQGGFVAGDDRLRADGLPAGRASAPLAGRQMAIVDTRDGYVLLTVDPNVIWRLRASVTAGVIVILLLVLATAYLIGGRWSRAVASGLERASEQREERLRAFLAEAAHELRTPLAIAIGYVGILERGGLEDAALAARIVRDVATEHTRLQQLVERILLLARLDAVPPVAGVRADAAVTAEEAVALVRPLDADLHVTVRASGPAPVAIAPDELRDALRNLLENAIRYAPSAPVTITIVPHGGHAVIDVADAGPGMDAFAVAHAFDRFYRGPDRGDVPGTGLGLAIVRRIAERSGGSATLGSTPAGTTVTLRLPQG